MQDILEKVIHLFAKLPGLGPRSARRIVLHLLNTKSMKNIALEMLSVAESIHSCRICHNIAIASDVCGICNSKSKNEAVVCVVENIVDLWAIERSNNYNGLYHILGGTLAAVDGITPDKLNIASLQKRIQKGGIEEIIIATNATLEGETTGHYIAELFKDSNVTITRLAHGIPMGAELDYIDSGTLSLSLKTRHFWK